MAYLHSIIFLFQIIKPWQVRGYICVTRNMRNLYFRVYGLSIRYAYRGVRIISGINMQLIWTFTRWKLRRLTCSHFCFFVLAFHCIEELFISSCLNKEVIELLSWLHRSWNVGARLERWRWIIYFSCKIYKAVKCNFLIISFNRFIGILFLSILLLVF